MLFFVGMHHPSDAKYMPRAFISVNRIKDRKSEFEANDWIMDSGAFTTVSKLGMYPEPPSAYAETIRRFRNSGNLLAAVSEDFMCEDFILEKTGMTITEHQTLTVSRYRDLTRCDTGGVYIMPVLQGYSPHEYVDCIKEYGDLLKPNQWVGVGSVCKRNTDIYAVLAVLTAIHRQRPDLKLHGFGLKQTALGSPTIRRLLYSADSMAWSFAARYNGGDANSPLEALKFYLRITADESDKGTTTVTTKTPPITIDELTMREAKAIALEILETELARQNLPLPRDPEPHITELLLRRRDLLQTARLRVEAKRDAYSTSLRAIGLEPNIATAVELDL